MNLYDLPPSRNIEDRRHRGEAARGTPWRRQVPQSLLDMMDEREKQQSGFRPIQRAQPGMASSLGYNAISPQPQRGMLQPAAAMMQQPFWADYMQQLTRGDPNVAAQLNAVAPMFSGGLNPRMMFNNPAR